MHWLVVGFTQMIADDQRSGGPGYNHRHILGPFEYGFAVTRIMLEPPDRFRLWRETWMRTKRKMVGCLEKMSE